MTTPSGARRDARKRLDIRMKEERDAQGITLKVALGDAETVTYRIDTPLALPPVTHLDFALIAGIFLAMRRNQPVHVHGPVSPSLLRNIEEFQEAWAAWMPKRYSVVPITADAEIEPPAPSSEKAILAFSGGVDAAYSLMRNVNKDAGRRSVQPLLGVLVHGFDIPLGEVEPFEFARSNAARVLDGAGVSLATVATDWRRICYDWEMEHAAGIIACLTLFAPLGTTGMLGGDEGYEKIDIPWGSNPIANVLLSSQNFAIRTEGMGLSRAERVAYLVDTKYPLETLRVCWQHTEEKGNCGVCAKCIRTKENILAAGGTPQGFRKAAGLIRFALVPSKSTDDNYFMADSLRVAKKRGQTGPWTWSVRFAIFKNYFLYPWFYAKEALKRRIREDERLYWAIRRIFPSKFT